MSTKTATWIGMFVGSSIGGFVPYLWNGSPIAYIFWSGMGAVAGIYCGFNFAKYTGG
jgi:hypothetical protein